jgi:hypothetical protein
LRGVNLPYRFADVMLRFSEVRVDFRVNVLLTDGYSREE